MLLQSFFQWTATTGTVWVRSSWRRSCRSCRRRSKCCSSDTVGTWRNSWDWRTQSASWDKATCWMKSGCSCLRGWRALSIYMKLDKIIYFLWNNRLSQRWRGEGTEHIRVKIQWKCETVNFYLRVLVFLRLTYRPAQQCRTPARPWPSSMKRTMLRTCTRHWTT